MSIDSPFQASTSTAKKMEECIWAVESIRIISGGIISAPVLPGMAVYFFSPPPNGSSKEGLTALFKSYCCLYGREWVRAVLRNVSKEDCVQVRPHELLSCQKKCHCLIT